MKRVVLAVVVAAILASATGAMSSILPHARRTDGDPDEFQSGKILDEGVMVRDLGIPKIEGRQQTPTGTGGMKPRSGAQVRPMGSGQYRVFSIGLSGKIVFLEK
jgi:hypothetical protein